MSLPPTRKISNSSTASGEVFPNGQIHVSPSHDSNGHSNSLSNSALKSVSGVLFALKHWICKHFFVSCEFYNSSKQYCLASVPSRVWVGSDSPIYSVLLLQHFREDRKLAEKLETLIEHATHTPHLAPNESTSAQEVSSMYQMQKDAQEELTPVMQLKLSKEQIHLVCSM